MTFLSKDPSALDNHATTGSVIISGTAKQGQTLTASHDLADIDGLGTISYQWNRAGVAITDATESTYVLTQDDVGKKITVTASYADSYSTYESVTSSETTAVANLNDAPTGSVTISGTATQGQTLTASNDLADIDGLGTIAYQWNRAGTAITGATENTYVLTQDDVGKTIAVTASYTDFYLTEEAVTSSETTAVANVNDSPTGSVSISGAAKQGQVLTASNDLADADGLGTITYQWNRNGTAISDASNSTYVLSPEDVGERITVTASYTDGHGSHEESVSSETDIVKKANIPLFSASDSILTSGRIKFSDDKGSDSTLAAAEFGPTDTQIVSAELEETTEGAVDISDVISQLRHIVGLSELTGLNKAAADNDANGSVDISDVISSLRQIVGLQDAPNARIVDAQGNHQFMFDDSVTELYVVAAGDADLSWTPLELI